MKRNLFRVLSITLVGLTLVSVGAYAQNEEPERPDTYRNVSDYSIEFDSNEYVFDERHTERDRRSENSAQFNTVVIGNPGFSMRYEQTHGTLDEAYFSDHVHLNYPYGVGTDGTNVWIAETDGNRAIKFQNDGTFVMQIGKAGSRFGVEETELQWLSDVEVGPGGNVWVVSRDSQHVVKFDSGGNYISHLGEMGDSGTDSDHFSGPRSLAFDSNGNIYISDRGNSRIQIFDNTETYYATIGTTGVPGSGTFQFNRNNHITIDSDDLLYVPDASNSRVQIYDVADLTSISYVATIGVTGSPGDDATHLNYPFGVHVDSSKIYIADCGNDHVKIFNRTSRTYLSTLGTGSGLGNYEFDCPSDVAVDSDGNIYVSDFNFGTRVQQYDSSLTYVQTFGVTGVPYLTDENHYNRPSGIAFDDLDNMYILEYYGQRLVKLDSNRVSAWTVGNAGVWGYDNDHFGYANDVAVSHSGNAVYVADTWNHRIQIYDATGTYINTLGSGQGSGDFQFDVPYGIAVDNSDNIYVADRNNHRVQIFSDPSTLIGTIGQTGITGTGNYHFNRPSEVHVDNDGNIYVADRNNYRVQIYNSSYTYIGTIGETGVQGSDFGQLWYPYDIDVDKAGRIYVADDWDSVHVFDNSRAYIATIGNYWGTNSNQFRGTEAVALDPNDNLYVADYLNHRIQEYAPGVPNWVSTNINGYGDIENNMAMALNTFKNELYVGTYNWGGNGAQLWKKNGSSGWTSLFMDGFGNSANVGIDHLYEFDSDLYASTWADETNGGEVWRSSSGDSGSWSKVVSSGFGDTTNAEVFRLAEFNNMLYATTWSYTDTHGTEIWRSTSGDGGSWNRVVNDGFDADSANVVVLSLEVFNGYMYAGTDNEITGTEVWRSNNGTSWSKVNTDGFGDQYNRNVTLEEFNGYLYAGTYNYKDSDNPGAELWRCQTCDSTDWTEVSISKGFGDTNNRSIYSLIVFNDTLFAFTYNRATGMEVWRSTNGTAWEQESVDGLGDSNNFHPYWDNSVTIHNNNLYVGTRNDGNGGEVWMYLDKRIFLPLIMR